MLSVDEINKLQQIKQQTKEYIKKLKTILINDRYLIYADGCIYDTTEAKDIPQWVFKLRDKILGDGINE